MDASGSTLSKFLKTAIPIIIGTLIVGINNVADGIFISRWVGPTAMGAVTVVLPLQLLIAAIATMLSAGMAAAMSKLIGQTNLKQAGETAGHTIQFGIVFSIIFTVAGMFFLPEVLTAMSIEPVFYDFAVEYAKPILIASSVFFLLPILADFYRAEGKVQIMMMILLSSSLLNILFNFLFVTVLGWGVTGASYATIIAGLISSLIALAMYMRGKANTQILFSFNVFAWPAIMFLGFPTLVAQIGVAIQTFLVNTQFLQYGHENWVIAYGVIGRLSVFMILPVVAMLIAFQTLCGFSLGAKQYDEVKALIKVAFCTMTVFASGSTILVLFFPEALMRLFIEEEALIQYGVDFVHYCIWGLPLIGVGMLATGFYQANGQARMATFFSSLRVICLFVPLSLILPELLGLKGVFIAIVAADVIAAVLTIVIVQYQYKKYVSNSLDVAVVS
ncbi:MATE family efflux transporter [Veronia nyctiphanis]|uniref:Multidrug resistance protein NorM n=1 Tax=Veronia nyctiphanis TaxID=1278244 RepID=A0A4Q0YYD4_9GAMM|nr:MATE family efflux transporter [Veronia nyctiphanis]RXJ74229.1 MATE family efflux transporter [Veronia nyctiphanis]